MTAETSHERAPAGDRPAVSVCVPFLGNSNEATELLGALAALELADRDEVIVADNTPTGILAARAPAFQIRTVAATSQPSSYYSRNVAANAASNDWLLFLDSDCRPRADLVERYFSDEIPKTVGAVAGAVLPLSRSHRLMARYAESRSANKQAMHLQNPFKPFGVTANLLVRRQAWEDVGGFLDGVRSGGDADFNWRIQDAGWSVAYREEAWVRHFLREDMGSYLRVHARYMAGRRWIGLRHPGSGMGPKPQRLFRAIAGTFVWPLRGQLERGVFKAIDGLVIAAETFGYLFGNGAPARRTKRSTIGPLWVMTDSFPVPSETFVVNEVRAIDRLGRDVRVEVRSRPFRPAVGAAWGLDVRYWEDTGILREVVDLAWLLARHPLRCVGDLTGRRRWRREEPVAPLRVLAPVARRLARERVEHMHIHFARRAALDAMRLGRLLRIPYSLTAHAWEIFKQPSNLVEKIDCSTFTTTGCDYNVRHLRALFEDASSQKIHKVVMGVDPTQFRRTIPYDGHGTVLAVGRLLEKKGFTYLLDAAARIKDFEAVRKVVIVGDGRLRDELKEQRNGIGGVVDLVGAKRHDEVRDLLEKAALLVMPCVVAADGDRDSMPVVVKEALAMGVPVIASDEVGLPEVVHEEWGRLVPPADPDALAGAIRELLSMPRETRAEMGQRGRDFVLGQYGVDDQTKLLLSLIDAE